MRRFLSNYFDLLFNERNCNDYFHSCMSVITQERLSAIAIAGTGCPVLGNSDGVSVNGNIEYR